MSCIQGSYNNNNIEDITMTEEVRSIDVELEKALRRLVQLVKGNLGVMANLATTEKGNLVGALNEIHTVIEQKSQINDETTALDSTWSSQKIQAALNTAIANIVNGAGEDADTLAELAEKIAAVAQADAGLLNVLQAQTLEDEQKAQGRSNLGLGALAVLDTQINDAATETTTTWSSEKIKTEFDNVKALAQASSTTAKDFVAIVNEAWGA